MDCCDTQFWLVISGFIIAFVLAFGIGANDVANSFGTSVGSKVLTLKQACILATIFEILGSILIGAKVSGTIRKGILDPTIFVDHELELMLGYVSALSGCCIWLILATILNLPVSGTHSIVGATIGMAIVSKGIKVIKWIEILKIVSSWFISPLLSGIVSLLMFLLIRRFILRASSPLDAGLKYLPFIYTLTIFVNLGGVLESAPPLLGFDKIPWWGKLIMISGISTFVYVGVWLILVPVMRKKIEANNLKLSLAEENEEKEKLNALAIRDSGFETNKKSISTQVDYVTLIVARNTEDWRFFDKYDLDEQILRANPGISSEDASRLIQQQQQQQQQARFSTSHPQTASTIHNDSNYNPMVRKLSSRGNRTRLDSAPPALKDLSDYGDVNLALGGYLHTIHSPSIRQQLTLRSYGYKFNNSRQNLGPNQNTVQGGSGGSGIQIFSKLFAPNAPNNQNSKENQNDDGQLPLLNPESGATSANNSAVSEKKYGRFTSVPAKIELKSYTPYEKTTKNDLILEVDAEVEENISELPQKRHKKLAVDDFAHTDPPEAAKIFSFLQVLTAVFGSFAHGGNDVSNAIGPLIGLYLIYQEGKIVDKSNTPEWILFYGGVGISVGLWILGRRVIKTIGEDLTKITASSGFVIELASAMTVLGASLINIPVSTTHCKVGSVVFTGRVRSKQSVDWSLFRNIIIAWIVTVPVTGSIAAGCQLVLKIAFGLKL